MSAPDDTQVQLERLVGDVELTLQNVKRQVGKLATDCTQSQLNQLTSLSSSFTMMHNGLRTAVKMELFVQSQRLERERIELGSEKAAFQTEVMNHRLAVRRESFATLNPLIGEQAVASTRELTQVKGQLEIARKRTLELEQQLESSRAKRQRVDSPSNASNASLVGSARGIPMSDVGDYHTHPVRVLTDKVAGRVRQLKMRGGPRADDPADVEAASKNLWMFAGVDEEWARISDWLEDPTPGEFCFPTIATYGYNPGMPCRCREVFPDAGGEFGEDWHCMAVRKHADGSLEFF